MVCANKIIGNCAKCNSYRRHSADKKQQKKIASSLIFIVECPIWFNCFAQHTHCRHAYTGKPEILLLPTHYIYVCNDRAIDQPIDQPSIYTLRYVVFFFFDIHLTRSFSFNRSVFFGWFSHRSQYIIRSGAFSIPFFVCVEWISWIFDILCFFIPPNLRCFFQLKVWNSKTSVFRYCFRPPKKERTVK